MHVMPYRLAQALTLNIATSCNYRPDYEPDLYAVTVIDVECNKLILVYLTDMIYDLWKLAYYDNALM